jgi:transcriptional regulator with XRE-family HTH domain
MMKGNFMYYTQRLKELRKESGLTQQAAAEKIRIKREQYRRYENGINEIKANYIIKLCDAFHVSADYLLGRTDKKEP